VYMPFIRIAEPFPSARVILAHFYSNSLYLNESSSFVIDRVHLTDGTEAADGCIRNSSFPEVLGPLQLPPILHSQWVIQ
jgi:hypothetical protein